MDEDSRLPLIATVVVVLVLGLLWLAPRVKRTLDPELLSALVAVEVEGEGVARVGAVEVPAGQPFRLHAVLTARARNGETVYYTGAGALQLADGEVSGDRLRVWNRPQEVRVLWFTVEGSKPYLEVESLEQLAEFGYDEVFQPDWARSWSIPGTFNRRSGRFLNRDSLKEEADFGIARFAVRIELYDDPTAALPVDRFSSPGAAALPASPELVTTATRRLPGGLSGVSAIVGLSQVEPVAQAERGLLAELAGLWHDRLAFSRLAVLRSLVSDAGRSWDTLAWRAVELDSTLQWGTDVGPGDLLRVGGRVVVIYRDAAAEGRLDSEDLCFDFARGLSIVPLAQVFVGDGLVELGRLGGAATD